MESGEADLGGLLEAAGRSLEDAQQQLGAAEGVPGISTAMAISEVELELKITLEKVAKEIVLRPVSSSDAEGGKINVGLASTLRVRYVAVADEIGTVGAAPRQPERTADAVIEEARKRQDVAPLDEAVQGLRFQATFVPEAGSWLVQAIDRDDRVVREVVVPDARP